jgi:hypothetical protein
MSSQKWGESFLKSGLPLEHLTLLALKSIGWTCELHSEYLRVNREGAAEVVRARCHCLQSRRRP